jgi:hypothetical protein
MIQNNILKIRPAKPADNKWLEKQGSYMDPDPYYWLFIHIYSSLVFMDFHCLPGIKGIIFSKFY